MKFRLKKQVRYERHQELKFNFLFMEQCARHIPETAQSQIIPPDETVTVEDVSRAVDFTIQSYRIIMLKKILIMKILQSTTSLIRKTKYSMKIPLETILLLFLAQKICVG